MSLIKYLLDYGHILEVCYMVSFCTHVYLKGESYFLFLNDSTKNSKEPGIF